MKQTYLQYERTLTIQRFWARLSAQRCFEPPSLHGLPSANPQRTPFNVFGHDRAEPTAETTLLHYIKHTTLLACITCKISGCGTKATRENQLIAAASFRGPIIMFIAFYSHLLQLHLSRSWITSHNATSSAIERRSRHLRRQEHVMISTYGSRLVSFHQSYLCRAVSSDRLRILTVMSMQAMFRTLCTTGESSINFSECSDHGFF
ncbi:hypothetical protein RB195_009141 [Necator americanus]|uniref:Uncharacterized protein n=1 Tax=Necator americanus TaxID=51031 RepID=A0ABR1CSQ9_NECAM